MKVTFIYHSCFTIEFEDIVLVFDYYKGKLPKWECSKKVIFFASHKHRDHFSLEILRNHKEYEQVEFVLSNDIKFTDKFLERHGVDLQVKNKITHIGKDSSVVLGNGKKTIKVETLRSTDEGVAFIITYEGKTIYHAGDLNWWAWKGETEEEYKVMAEGYQREINKLSDKKIDVAFVVLDPRQEERYWWGMDYFLNTVDADIVFPMHCWEKYKIIDQFKLEKSSESYINKVMEIRGERESFNI
ncbi:MBL fold metallo-hydrolase [[Clostridium] polysaccharolyticum]|uniref:L-ascorbate metabolism protein UlaG, beta-lactamase superfamily n=1 Tax=[Clostridium] polysaccharolyticum TaxID=29364 RepID=A0A1I0G779_9FIRM|nr:MBL fold metallo-hydrolase [[Clostridium] polysaccharolyticum]SET66525.1 L-ascorbate metabolism protein UlaG, beta-lactamase superfamily [[Clostridium] polysaccharolyticum]